MHWRTFNRRLDQIKRVDAVAMADAGAIPYAHVRGEHIRIPHIQAGSATWKICQNLLFRPLSLKPRSECAWGCTGQICIEQLIKPRKFQSQKAGESKVQIANECESI